MSHEGSEGSWAEELRIEVVHEFLARIVGSAESAKLDLPHIVVCRDIETGAVSYSGPFPDGVSALVFAERESAVDRELNDGEPLSFGVAALYPSERPEAG
ncbi:MAG TPA: hypothetical protein VFE15_13300 [Marmoricola sp.]|nr:hypothetical protein [Marmoricola sp.]